MKAVLVQIFTLALMLATPVLAADTSLEGLQKRIVGQWTSITFEMRPQQNQADPKLGLNPAVEGAWSQDYVLNKKLELTIMAPPMVEQFNQLPDGACGDGPFVVGEVRDILGKPCVLLKFVEGSDIVVDHDFLYVREDTPNMLFMGGKHVDGTGFYTPENRPTVGLQQPLIRVE